MADKINQPSITARLDIGDLKPNVAEANKTLDGLTAAPVEKLSQKSEAALAKINEVVGKTVGSLGTLRAQLSSEGMGDNRLLKSVEQDFKRLQNLGLDSPVLSQLAGKITELGGKSDFVDPEVAAWKKSEEEREKLEAARAKETEQRNRRLADLDDELQKRSTRVYETLKSREVAAEKKRTDAIEKSRLKEEEFHREALKDEQRRSKVIGDVAGKLLDTVGVSLPNKATDFLGTVGLGLGGALAVGQAGANVRDAQRTSGISGGGFQNAVLGVQQLPILRQLSEAAGEFGSVLGLDTSTSKHAADLDRLNEAAAIYEKFRQGAATAATEDARVTRDNAATLKALDQQFARTTLGGVSATRFDIGAGRDNTLATAAGKRDDAKSAADSQISAIASSFAKDTENLRNTAAGRSGTPEGDAAQKQLTSLGKARDAAITEQKQRKDAADKAYNDQAAAVNRNASLQDQIAAGYHENTSGVMDQLGELDRQARDISGDPFESLTKSFMELKPGAESLSQFNDQLGRYKTAVKGAEDAAEKFSANKAADKLLGDRSTAGKNGIDASFEDNVFNKGLSYEKARALQQRAIADAGANALKTQVDTGGLIGKSPEERAIQELINAGVTNDPILAKIKVQLDANAAFQVATDLKQQIAGIGDQVRENLARTPDARARAEVAAQDRVLRGPNGNGQGLTDVEKGNLTGAKLDAFYSQQAAATRDAVKTPLEKLADTYRDLQGQAKFLTPDELNRAAGSALKDFNTAPRPELIEAGSAAAQQVLAVSSGEVFDSSNPQLAVQKDSLATLKDILTALKPRTLVAIQ